jgi:16S rRNA (cytosine1402-N4)-methyltransferase
LKLVGPEGKLISFDLDAKNIASAQEKLTPVGHPFALQHGNFAGFPTVLAEQGLEGCDCLLADLGMSSMQVDDSERGFSFMRDGPLDMRMDQSRGRTAAELLNTLPVEDLASCFRELGDEPEADKNPHHANKKSARRPASSKPCASWSTANSRTFKNSSASCRGA